MTTTPLPLRNDTFLGVCEGLGRDLGLHPNILRIGFASAFYVSPMIVIATYVGFGLVVAASRWVFPDRSPADSAPRIQATGDRGEAPPLAIAA